MTRQNDDNDKEAGMTSARRYFAVFATDRPDMQAVRQAVRPRHRAYLRDISSHGVFVCMGGPTLAPQGDTMNGTLLIVQAPSLADVRRFVQDDPYAQANLFEHVEIRPWNWTLGNPDGQA